VDDIQDRLNEQLEYYRNRAPEYDLWALRAGRWDRGPDNEQWFGEVDILEAELAAFRPAGHVLELACGTGQWTERLVRHAGRITAVDAAPEVLEINRQRIDGAPVEYIQHDLFTWDPPSRFDVVFFSFWLSHVPPERFDDFWTLVRQCLVPGGRVFFIDNLPSPAAEDIDPELEGPDETTVRRRLSDGREFVVWKVLFEPGDLEARLTDLGWDIRVKATGDYFLYGAGAPRT
jgi:demethylmenaquinone methyltransferase/2-methoxy-6-polyprenyl-1,4-benzoquinol methylase